MTRIPFPLVFVILFGFSGASANNRPNIVFVMADDCTFHDLECYGGQAKTPNMNRLLSAGMKFNQCFQAAPMCSPTRHNIYTGLYPVKSGAYPNHTFVKQGVKSVVQYLKPAGYRVALSGKTHVSPKSVFDFEYSGKDNNPDMESIDQLIAESVETETPFCVFACSNEPHGPYTKGDPSAYPAESIKLPPYVVDTPECRQQWRRYLAEITYFDDQVGQILNLLEKHNQVDNTLVMVVSEQGNGFPFAKWTCYDNGLQSAMIVRWPGKVAASSTTDAMVEYVDILPTFMEAAGIQGEGHQAADRLDGKSFLPVLTGEATDHKAYTYSLMTTRGIINGSDLFPIRSIRSHQYRLILNLTPENEFTNAITQGKVHESFLKKAEEDETAATLVKRYGHRPAIELYDVVADPMNLNNLAGHPEMSSVVDDLKDRLESWMIEQGDEGIETERRAFERQKRGRKKKKNAGMKGEK